MTELIEAPLDRGADQASMPSHEDPGVADHRTHLSRCAPAWAQRPYLPGSGLPRGTGDRLCVAPGNTRNHQLPAIDVAALRAESVLSAIADSPIREMVRHRPDAAIGRPARRKVWRRQRGETGAEPSHPAYRLDDVTWINRLDQEDPAKPPRLGLEDGIGERTGDDCLNVRAITSRPHQQLQPVKLAEANIDDQDVGRLSRPQKFAFLERRGLEDVKPSSLRAMCQTVNVPEIRVDH